MLKKKIAALLIAAQTLTVSTMVIEAAGSLDDYTPATDTQLLQVAGKFDKTDGFAPRITLYILNQGYSDLKSLTSSNASEIIKYTDETTALSDGSFKFDEFTFSGDSGKYKIIVKSSKDSTELTETFDFVSPLEKQKIIEEQINKVKEPNDFGIDPKNIFKQILSQEHETLELKYDLFDKATDEGYDIYDKAMDRVFDAIPYNGENPYLEFIDAYRGAMFIEVARACDLLESKEGELTIYDIFEDYGMAGLSDAEKIVYEKVYKNFSGTDFLKLKNDLDTEAVTIDDYMSEVVEAAVLQKINNSSLSPVIYKVLEDAEKYIGLDNTDYGELTDGQKDKVAEMIVERESFSSVDELSDYIINTAVPEAAKSSGKKPSTDEGSSKNNSSPSNIYRGGVNVVAQTPSSSQADKKTTFKDLDEAKWAEEYITTLVNRGIFAGRTAEIFDPNGQITREEFVKIIVNAFELKDTGKEISFTDVNKDAWYYSYVLAAANQSIINGISETEFGTGTPITREQMATIMARTCDKVGVALSQDKNDFEFVDSSMISSYAKDSVERLKSAGVLNGDNNGYFNPGSYATRAEAATMLYALLEV